MKTLILLLSLLAGTQISIAQKLTMKGQLEAVPATTLPFICEKECRNSQPVIGIAKEFHGNLPIYSYKDLGATIQTNFKNDECVIFRRLQPTNGNYYLAALRIGASNWQKRILVTFDSQDAKVIDLIECEIYLAMNEGWLYTKQWKVDEKMQVTVYAIKLISPEKVMFGTEFPPIQAQRVDTHYQISPEGKFSRTKEVKYKPQTYTKAYLEDRTKNFWDGTETVEK